MRETLREMENHFTSFNLRKIRVFEKENRNMIKGVIDDYFLVWKQVRNLHIEPSQCPAGSVKKEPNLDISL